MKKIIIDTDPGVDDALAIFFACYANIDILALTTVFGNSSVGQSSRNACSLLGFLNKNIPIYEGEKKPLNGRATYAQSHGKNALGGFRLANNNKKIEKMDAVSYLLQTLSSQRNITLACIGPLTNIARALRMKPSLAENIGAIVILGGVFGEEGNVSKYAEFNTYNDPLALKEVLSAECRKIMIPANVCRKVYFTKKDFDKVHNGERKKLFQKISEEYIRYYMSDPVFGGFQGGVMYDLLTMAYILDATLFDSQLVNVQVNLSRGKKYGMTTLSRNIKPNAQIMTDVNARSLKKLFLDTVNAI